MELPLPDVRGRPHRNGALPRTQSSVAIRGADGPWFLANASPDLRQQLEGLAAEGVNGSAPRRWPGSC